MTPENQIEAAEKTTQDHIDSVVAILRAEAKYLVIEGKGDCIVCGEPARSVVHNDKTIMTRFCSDQCVSDASVSKYKPNRRCDSNR